MSTIRYMLVDDEPRGLSSLQTLLEMHAPDMELIGAYRRPDDALRAIRQDHPDLVFLDIAMPGKNAFEMLEAIPEIDFEIIFVTAYNDYTEQALHLSAVDYLLKPVAEDLLIEAVKRAEKRIEQKTQHDPLTTLLHNLREAENPRKQKLCIPSMRGYQVIDIRHIIYIEANSNYSNFYIQDRPMVCASKSLHEYASLLEDCNFIRVHKSYVINLEHVTDYIRGEGGSVQLTGGKQVEVSRRKKDILMQKMRAHFRY